MCSRDKCHHQFFYQLQSFAKTCIKTVYNSTHMLEKANGSNGHQIGDLFEVVYSDDKFVEEGGATLPLNTDLTRQTIGALGRFIRAKETPFMGGLRMVVFLDHHGLSGHRPKGEEGVYCEEEVKVVDGKTGSTDFPIIWWTNEIWNRCLS